MPAIGVYVPMDHLQCQWATPQGHIHVSTSDTIDLIFECTTAKKSMTKRQHFIPYPYQTTPSVEPFQPASTTSTGFLQCEKYYTIPKSTATMLSNSLLFGIKSYSCILGCSYLDQNSLEGTLPDMSSLIQLQTLWVAIHPLNKMWSKFAHDTVKLNCIGFVCNY